MMRFSEIMLSSSNLPTLMLSQLDFRRLLKRTLADSKPKTASLSAAGTSKKLMFFASVPAVRISIPERSKPWVVSRPSVVFPVDRKSTRLNSSHSQISYAVFCLKKKKKNDISVSSGAGGDGASERAHARVGCPDGRSVGLGLTRIARDASSWTLTACVRRSERPY